MYFIFFFYFSFIFLFIRKQISAVLRNSITTSSNKGNRNRHRIYRLFLLNPNQLHYSLIDETRITSNKRKNKKRKEELEEEKKTKIWTNVWFQGFRLCAGDTHKCQQVNSKAADFVFRVILSGSIRLWEHEDDQTI